MVSVALTGIRLNLASDPSLSLFFPYGTGLQSQPATSVVTLPVFADGGSRKSRQPGYQAKLSATLEAVTADQIVLLEFDIANGGWLGETVCVRDHLGRKFYGYWDPPTISAHAYNTEADVAIVFHQITYSEVA